MYFFEKVELVELISLISTRYLLFSISISCPFKEFYFYGGAIFHFHIK